MRIIIVSFVILINMYANNTESYNAIRQDMQEAINLYKIEDFSSAIQNVKFARHHGFRNSGLETKIRQEVSPETANKIESFFTKIIDSMRERKPLSQIKGLSTQMFFEIKMILPKLSQDTKHQKNKNWQKIAQKVIVELNRANEIYKAKTIKKAILHVQDVYFEIFENSGFEKAIMDISVDKKIKAEERFRVIQNMMKRGENPSNIDTVIQQASDDLEELAKELDPSSFNGMLLVVILAFLVVVLVFVIFMVRKK